MFETLLQELLTDENLRLFGVGSTIALGILAQWLAWRWRIPSILLLLTFGLLAGPITGLLHPDELFGETLLPLVSAGVAIILFEGGLSLQASEIQPTRKGVRNLIILGVGITFSLATLAAHFILGFDFGLAALTGGILVVTGPTVIGPLLRTIRPKGQVGPVLRWEGILTDPVGALLAVIIFEVVLIGDLQGSPFIIITEALLGINIHDSAVLSLIVGLSEVVIAAALGWVGAKLLAFTLRRYLIPDFLQNAVALAMALGFFAIANILQRESGLLTVTIMGVVLANDKSVLIKHILEFKEHLGVLLISSLFILLSERLSPQDLAAALTVESLLFLAVLILLVRPAAVLVSTIRSGLNWRERLFMSWMAPRGIVAAATASVFALELSHEGHPNAGQLAPVMFLVIIGTVAVYGLTSPWVARRLGLAASAEPQGLLIVGAQNWARRIAGAVRDAGFTVVLIDTNLDNIEAAHDSGLEAHYGSVLAEAFLSEIEPRLDNVGRLLAITPNDEVNTLAALHFRELFGRAGVYQLTAKCYREDLQGGAAVPEAMRGRTLFQEGVTSAYLDAFAEDGQVQTLTVPQGFRYQDFLQSNGAEVIPLFLADSATRELFIFSDDVPPEPVPGQVLIYYQQVADAREALRETVEMVPVPAPADGAAGTGGESPGAL